MLRYAKRLEWVNILFLLTITVVMYLAMGNSQAMKTAWIEDVLSLIPAILFLVSVRFHAKTPNARFPYGYRRSVTVAFLGGSVAVLVVSLYMLYDAGSKLVTAHHPTIGMVKLFGMELWMGWVMIAALIYSVIPPVILGRLKMKPARSLHEMTLYADAAMNKADWMTAVAGIVGVTGIGLGYWWADSVAAGVIALDVLKDGVTNTRKSVAELIDRRPTTVDRDEPAGIAEQIVERLNHLSWVEQADVRLRNEGHVVAGEVYVVPVDNTDLLDRLEEAARVAKAAHWRVYDIVVQPVRQLSEQGAGSE